MALADRYQTYLVNPNVRALLDTIRWAEGTSGADGYQTQFTGTKFGDLSRHPRQIRSSNGLSSDAAGAYQFLSTTWDGVSRELGLRDFTPRSQDLAALRLIERRGVNLDDVAKSGIRPDTFHSLAKEWASLPTRETGTSAYGQGGKKIGALLDYAQQRRGAVPNAGPLVPQGGLAVGAPAAPSAPRTESVDPLTALVQASLMPAVSAAPVPEMPSTSFSAVPTRALGEQAADIRMAGPGLNAGLTELLLGAIESASPRSLSGGSPDSQAFPSVRPAGPVVSDPGAPAPAAAASRPTSAGSSGSSPLIGIVDLGRMVEGTRMRVREHPKFGDGRVGGHSKNSLHYKGLAIDITDWEDPGESEKSWKPRKAWLGQQMQQLLAGTDAEVFGPHNDPAGHGSHIHLGLPSGSIRSDLAQGIVRLRQEALKRYPLRWAG